MIKTDHENVIHHLMMNKTYVVTKKNIVSKMYKKLGRELNQRLVQDAVNALCVKLQEALIQNQAVSIENFGTISPFIFHKHNGMNIQTGKLQEIAQFRTVRFHPHSILLELLSQHRDSFIKDKVNTGRNTKKVDKSA